MFLKAKLLFFEDNNGKELEAFKLLSALLNKKPIVLKEFYWADGKPHFTVYTLK